VTVEFAMMKATNRHRELIADLASKMVRIGRFTGAHDASLFGHQPEGDLSRSRTILAGHMVILMSMINIVKALVVNERAHRGLRLLPRRLRSATEQPNITGG
jgi:hypothetical protein